MHVQSSDLRATRRPRRLRLPQGQPRRRRRRPPRLRRRRARGQGRGQPPGQVGRVRRLARLEVGDDEGRVQVGVGGGGTQNSRRDGGERGAGEEDLGQSEARGRNQGLKS